MVRSSFWIISRVGIHPTQLPVWVEYGEAVWCSSFITMGMMKVGKQSNQSKGLLTGSFLLWDKKRWNDPASDPDEVLAQFPVHRGWFEAWQTVMFSESLTHMMFEWILSGVVLLPMSSGSIMLNVSDVKWWRRQNHYHVILSAKQVIFFDDPSSIILYDQLKASRGILLGVIQLKDLTLFVLHHSDITLRGSGTIV